MKPIAGPNMEPFGLGGFCINGANIDGRPYTKLNIYQQRSDVLFDLIDGDGIIHQYIQLVHVDSNQQPLDPNESDSVLQSKIGKNTFFIKTQDPNTLEPTFIFQYYTNLIKLSNGEVAYRPWEYVNFCNAEDENQINKVSKTKSTLTVNPTSVAADGQSKSTITLTLRDDEDNVLTAISSGVSFTVTGFTSSDHYKVSDVDYSQASSGIFTATIMAIQAGTGTITAHVNSIDITQTAQVTFTGSGLDVVDPANSTITASSPVVADFNSTSTITLTLKDSYGNPITDVQSFVNLSLTGYNNTSDYEWGAIDSSNAENGIYTVTLKSKRVLITTITAVVRGVTLSQTPTITFTGSNVPSREFITIYANPNVVTEGDNYTTNIRLTIKDKFGNPVKIENPANVSLGISGYTLLSRYTISEPDLSSNALGVYLFTIVSREAADVLVYPVIATLPDLSSINAAVAFTHNGLHGNNQPPTYQSTFARTGEPTAPADGSTVYGVTSVLKSSSTTLSNMMTGVSPAVLEFRVMTAGCTATTAQYADAGFGVVTVGFIGTTPGAKVIEVYYGTSKIGTFSITFDSTGTSAAKTTFTATPATAKINGTVSEQTVNLKITRFDALNNPINFETSDEISTLLGGYKSSSDAKISSWTYSGNVATATATSKLAVTATYTAVVSRVTIEQKPSVKFYWNDKTGSINAATHARFFKAVDSIKNDGIDDCGLYVSFTNGDGYVAGLVPSDVEFFVVSPALDADEYSIEAIAATSENYASGGPFDSKFRCKTGGISVVIGVKVKGVTMPEQQTIEVLDSVVIDKNLSTLYATSPVDNKGVGRFSDIVFYPRTDDGESVTSLTSGGVTFKCSDPDAVFTYDYSKADTGLITGTMECPNVGKVDVTATVGSVTVGPVSVDVLDWIIPDANNSYIVVESPVQVDTNGTFKLYLRNFNGNPVILDSGVEIEIESLVLGTYSTGTLDYSQKEQGIYTITATSSGVIDLLARATASGIRLNAQAKLSIQSDAVTPALSTMLLPRFLNTAVGETFEFNVDFSGINIDSSVKTGSWTISDSSAIQFISNAGTTFKAIAKKVGAYSVTFYPDATPTKTVSGTLYIMESNRFRTATFGYEALTKKLPWSIVNEGDMPSGIPVNSGTEAVLSVNYTPSSYVPSGPVQFYAQRYTPTTGSLSDWDVPFTVVGSPDNLNFYVRFDKGYHGIFNVTMTQGSNLSYGDMQFKRQFTFVILNPDGIYSPKLTVSPTLQCTTLDGALRIGEGINASMYASWSWSNTVDLSKMRELPYIDELEFVSSQPEIAKFEDNGILRGVSPGTTILEAKFKNYPTNPITMAVGSNYPYRIVSYKPEGFRVPSYNVPCTPSPVSFPAGSTNFSIISNSTDSAVTINPDKSITVKTTIYLRPISVVLNFKETMPVNLKSSPQAQLLNPSAGGATISSISLLTTRVSFPYIGSSSNEQYKVGDIMNISGVAGTSYGNSQEEYIIHVSDPTILEQCSPYYFNAPLNVLNDSAMFRAVKAGVCTVSVFYPASGHTTSTDVEIVAHAAPSPYVPKVPSN